MDSNVKDGFVHNQPKVLAERQALGRILVDKLKYRMPVLIDPIDDRAEKAFAAWPERIYVIGAGGRVAFKGGMGPFEFKPEEAVKSLEEILGPGR
jgi:hypothetical protein